MTKMINGLRYSTDTSVRLARWVAFEGDGLRQEEEELFQTPKGAYFLSIWGGALTAHGVREGNTTRPGGGLQPMSRDEAAKWCEQRQQVAALAKHFADLIQDA